MDLTNPSKGTNCPSSNPQYVKYTFKITLCYLNCYPL